MTFTSLAGHKYMSLETFKRNGQGVSTPIWFAADPTSPLDSASAKLYVYTIGDTGKVKRIRNNGKVRVAPCDMRGKLLGGWADARAAIVAGDEAVRGTRLLNKKYWPLKQTMAFFASFSRRERVIIAIQPA
jgi:PPOX class probable F420-dependent enzyme